MIPHALQPLANHLWQSTVFAAAAGLLTLALRKNGAHVRYWVWFAASVKFLVPFAALQWMGEQFGRLHANAHAAPVWAVAVEQVSSPFVTGTPLLGAAAPVAASVNWALWAALVWLIGVALVLLAWGQRWLRVYGALRAATPVAIGLSIKTVESPAIFEPGVFGMLRPVLMIPAGLIEALPPAQTAALLEHEMCHVRRHDNLASALHMVVEAAFWFHPLVWWLGARLIEERERACDEAVLRMARDPRDYAQGILTVCERYLQSRLPCVSGISGANLKTRIEEIVNPRASRALGRSRIGVLAGVALLAVSLPVLAGFAITPLRPRRIQPAVHTAPLIPTKPTMDWTAAQSTAIASAEQSTGRAAQPPQFAAVSIKLAGKARSAPSYTAVFREDPGGLQPSGKDGSTLCGLIRWAYNLQNFQIQGCKDWTGEDLFSIAAITDRPATNDELNTMLRDVLATRFGLRLGVDPKPMSVLALDVAPGGLKLQPLGVGEDPPPHTRDSIPPGEIYYSQATLIMGLVGFLNGFGDFRPLDKLVVDRTGLKGNYDIYLTGPGGPVENGRGNHLDINLKSIRTSLQRMGLELNDATVKVDYYSIQSAHQPTPN